MYWKGATGIWRALPAASDRKAAAVSLGDGIAGVAAGAGKDNQLAVIVRFNVLEGRNRHLESIASSIRSESGCGLPRGWDRRSRCRGWQRQSIGCDREIQCIGRAQPAFGEHCQQHPIGKRLRSPSGMGSPESLPGLAKTINWL